MGGLIACVASVSVGLSAGLKHFSLFERAKIGASAKKSAETLATQARGLRAIFAFKWRQWRYCFECREDPGMKLACASAMNTKKTFYVLPQISRIVRVRLGALGTKNQRGIEIECFGSR